jgi:holliday junction DNA helicase RuvA
MITTIQGSLASATPLRAVVELNGLGYEVHIPVTTAEKLPQPGAVVKLHTIVIYREDSQTLYGFTTPEERDFFRLLIEHVTGVGPKMALSIMSRLSLPLLESAIRLGDVTTLSKCPGIGKKTAERLIIELRSKLGSPSAEIPTSASSRDASLPAGESRVRDAVAALTTLGYKAADADQAVRRALVALGAEATTEQLIKRALGS